MYGLILAGVKNVVVEQYGEENWIKLITALEVPYIDFTIHDVYSDDIIPKLVNALSEMAGLEPEKIMEVLGAGFLAMLDQSGYTHLLTILGRTLLDFLNGLDQLHDYLKFSYHKLKSPSFSVLHETRHGLTLMYRSRRKGLRLEYYIKGFIAEIGQRLYDTKVRIEIISKNEEGSMLTWH